MAAEPSSSSPPALSSGELITSVNHNDVLMGRGSGPNEFPGNLQFRSIVEQRSEEYKTVRKNKTKKKIAWEVLDRIHALGGRFLKEVVTETPVHDVEEGVWIEVEESVALQKCKQALGDQNREKQRPPVEYIRDDSSRQQKMPTATNPVLPPHFNSGLPAAFPPAGSMSWGLSQDLHHSMNISAAYTYEPSLVDSFLSSCQSGSVALPTLEPATSTNVGNVSVSPVKDNNCNVTTSSPSTLEANVSPAAPEEVSEFLFSVLEESDRPMFTDEHEEIERATMTDEERAAALSDQFGKKVEISTHQRKRARRDLDPKDIIFLVNQMRLEIERIPEDMKRALLEAQSKCRVDEFSDQRLERFLRCEGMNARLGAQRFASYWESRREVFGTEKFVSRMTLSEALRDDLVALEVGVCSLLPYLDSSGRQLLFWDPTRHTREGYTSESMLRAVWYVMEIAAEANHGTDSGLVQIIWDKNTTIWDCHHKVFSRVASFATNCWPIKVLANHVCCPPRISTLFLKPIMYAFMDKPSRSRTLFHDVPESQIIELLSNYGIMK